MTEPTVSTLCRRTQNILNEANIVLEKTITLARAIDLAPFRLANVRAAMNDNQHAWQELNDLATALELTGADRKL